MSAGTPQLTDAQKRVYKLEKEYNFREVAHQVRTVSKDTLDSTYIVQPSLVSLLSAWGEFAEIAHGSVDPHFVFREIKTLSLPKYPYRKYPSLADPGVRCYGKFKAPGPVNVQGYVAVRPSRNEVIIAFSGTSNLYQVFKDLDARHASYPFNSNEPGNPTVHNGFWTLYWQLRFYMKDFLKYALYQNQDANLVITGHSMGGAMSYLLALDLLLKSEDFGFGRNRGIVLAVFGCPRVGNADLVQLFNRKVQDYRSMLGNTNYFQEYSVKAFDDGVHCLPPQKLGFRHMCQMPLYLYQDNLYKVPAGNSESSFFHVHPSVPYDMIKFPLGGHNYYNNRNMEMPLSCIQKLDIGTFDGKKPEVTQLEERYGEVLGNNKLLNDYITYDYV